MTWVKGLLFFVPFFIVFQSYARVFNFKNENLAVFFQGSGGLSSVSNNVFAKSSGSSTVFSSSDVVAYNPAFDLGFLFKLSEGFVVTTSMQLLQTKQVVAKGTNSSGTELMTVTSDVFVMNPRLQFEVDVYNAGTSRFYINAGAGYADVSVDNKYEFTATGSTTYSSIADYTEKSNNYFISYTMGLGYEYIFVDNVTMNLDLGYRYLKVGQLTHKHDTTTINGAVSKGDVVKNNDGLNREFDLGGVYVGIGFRFYINVY